MSGDSKTETTLSNLTAETSYWITVAAVNTEGTGDSRNISAKTSASIVTYHYCVYVELTKKCVFLGSTTSGIGAAVVALATGSVIGFLLLLSVIIVLLILFIKYVNEFTQTLHPLIIVYN